MRLKTLRVGYEIAVLLVQVIVRRLLGRPECLHTAIPERPMERAIPRWRKRWTENVQS
jgi:hypothetical protein